MVQFKRVFLGNEEPPSPTRRATTAQKCVRAGGKHNDLEQVGHTARHHTFFEMLGNFSFGDYFKRDAIRFAWRFVTDELGLAPENLRVTVFREDAEARALWKEIAGLGDDRVFGLGEKDNFWQMADTGPCGPCTEIYVDLARVAKDWTAPDGCDRRLDRSGKRRLRHRCVRRGCGSGAVRGDMEPRVHAIRPAGRTELLLRCPRPSVDTGAGLERIAAVMQGVSNNFDTDLFAPLLASVDEQLGAVPLFGPAMSSSPPNA